jgi:hypothetical protein
VVHTQKESFESARAPDGIPAHARRRAARPRPAGMRRDRAGARRHDGIVRAPSTHRARRGRHLQVLQRAGAPHDPGPTRSRSTCGRRWDACCRGGAS